MVFASTLIWYHIHRQTCTGHTGTNRLTLTYEYILTPPVMCTQQLPVLQWIINLINLLCRGPWYLCFSKITSRSHISAD